MSSYLPNFNANLYANQYANTTYPQQLKPYQVANINYNAPNGLGRGSVVGSGNVQFGALGVSSYVPSSPGYGCVPQFPGNYGSPVDDFYGAQGGCGQPGPWGPIPGIGQPTGMAQTFSTAANNYGGRSSVFTDGQYRYGLYSTDTATPYSNWQSKGQMVTPYGVFGTFVGPNGGGQSQAGYFGATASGNALSYVQDPFTGALMDIAGDAYFNRNWAAAQFGFPTSR